MGLYPQTQGDARTKKHAAVCTGYLLHPAGPFPERSCHESRGLRRVPILVGANVGTEFSPRDCASVVCDIWDGNAPLRNIRVASDDTV